MRLPLLAMIIVFIVNIAADAYIYYKLKNKFRSKLPSRLHLILAVLLYLYLIVIIVLPKKSVDNGTLITIMWMLYGYFSVYVPKYIYVIISLIGYIPRLWKSQPVKWFDIVGIVLSLVVFIAMWWGALVTRTEYEVVSVDIEFKDLPQGFDGYRIIQFSDFHVGSYGNDTTFVSKVVDVINEQNADAVFFTGDIVNRQTDELLPYVDILKRIKAKDGVYSILGNHDYGDYKDWPSVEAKDKNNADMRRIQEEMNWRMLNNDYTVLKNRSDSMVLIGVENIGDPPFKRYGDLNKAYGSLNDSVFKIILSHNPSHWEEEILPETNIALTLSGHTYAMQIVLDIAGHKFSPSALRYKEWGGLYDHGGRKIYVNTGLGVVAVPMRIGATPEITLITLKKKK